MLCNVRDFDLPRSKPVADPGIRAIRRMLGGGGEPTCYESDKLGPNPPVKTEMKRK